MTLSKRIKVIIWLLWCVYLGLVAGETLSSRLLPPMVWEAMAAFQMGLLMSFMWARPKGVAEAVDESGFIVQLHTTFRLIDKLFKGPVTISFVTDRMTGLSFLKIACPHCQQGNRLTKGISGAICGACKNPLRSAKQAALGEKLDDGAQLVN